MPDSALLAHARDLYAVHGILPVAVFGKRPIGGKGWNTQTLATRLSQFNLPDCTGVGMQCGLIFHPVLGPVDHRVLDIDEKNQTRRDAFGMMFVHLLGDSASRITWRWGRGPACNLFTHGPHAREKYGSIQLLGPGKQAVGYGWHPEAGQYRWPHGDIFSVMPPTLDVKMVEACILAAGQHAGIPMDEKQAYSGSTLEISEAEISMLSANDFARYRKEVLTELTRIDTMPEKTGRGTALNRLGLRYGAIARYDPQLDAIFQDALARLPGDLGHGDVRDLMRGLDHSKGFSQQRDVQTAQQRETLFAEAMKLQDAYVRGQDVDDLLNKHIPPLRWLINRYLPHVGTLSLIGKPKIGKSFLVLEMALSIVEGGRFWDEQCTPTGVLLYMLEDSERRIKDRINKLRPERLQPKKTFRIKYRNDKDGPFRVNPDGSGGLLDNIRKHKRDYPDIGFVVIDMWKDVRGTPERNLDAYQATGQLVAPISALAQELDIVIFIIHHAKKGKIDPDDVSDAASGSNALAGATEGSWTIWKHGGKARIVAEVRESEDFDLQLEKTEGSLVWNPVESINHRSSSSTKTRIHNVLVAAGCELTPRDVALRLKIDDRTANARLHDLRNEGIVQSSRHGIYSLPGAQSRPDAILSALMQTGLVVPVTSKLRELHDPEGKYSHMGDVDATGFAFADDIIGAIERANFADGKHALANLVIHRLVIERKGVVWFFGPVINRTQQPLPWATKFPWSA